MCANGVRSLAVSCLLCHHKAVLAVRHVAGSRFGTAGHLPSLKDAPMANDEHIAQLKNGVAAWNAWREENRDIRPDFRGADLSRADLSRANLSEANLSAADLEAATLVDTDLTGADLGGCRIYGVPAWSLKLDTRTKQQNLVITQTDEPAITVDNIEVAQLPMLGAAERQTPRTRLRADGVQLRQALRPHLRSTTELQTVSLRRCDHALALLTTHRGNPLAEASGCLPTSLNPYSRIVCAQQASCSLKRCCRPLYAGHGLGRHRGEVWGSG
jgi:hypothetical protein